MNDPVHDRAIAQAAEEVRAYLVSVRGGAPFLSGRDGALLVSWLEAGLGVPFILAGIDRAAARARKARSTKRLTLAQVKRELTPKKPKKKAGGERLAGAGPTPTVAGGLDALVREWAGLDVPPGLTGARDALVARASAALAAGGSEDEQARAFIAAARAFQDQVFAEAPDRSDVLALVREELADLRGALGDAGFQEAVDLVVRDRLRTRFPRVCAQAVFDTLAPRAS